MNTVTLTTTTQINPEQFSQTLNIGQLNVGGNLRNKALIVHSFLVRHNIHMMFFSETGIIPPSYCKKILPGYSWYYHFDESNRGIGWAILDSLKDKIKTPHFHNRTSTILLTHNTISVQIMGVYGPATTTTKPTFWKNWSPPNHPDIQHKLLIGD
jgi:hypothetical protein